ncbi:MAG: hypothetical protein SGI74_04905 [Oligoflexia bacterium]|nr:hypothetical protein [Oligoflexia bacterium]
MSHFDKKFLVTACASLLVGSLFAGCSKAERKRDVAVNQPTTSAPVEKDTTSTTDSRVDDTKRHDHVYGVVEFAKGQHMLTQQSQRRLTALVNAIKSRGQIETAKLAVWSDREFSGNDQDLSREDRRLADRRAEAIENFLDDALDVSNVDIYNMAKRSNWLARLFNTEDAELKSLFGKRESMEINDEDYFIFKGEGRASRSVVIIERDLD